MDTKYKRIILEVPEEIHKIAKEQAKELNITLKEYLLEFILPHLAQRETIKREKK